MKAIFLAFALLFTFQASAVTYDRVCYLKDDFDDWAVWLNTDQVRFFDNDTNYHVKFKSVVGNNFVYADYQADTTPYEFLTVHYNTVAEEATVSFSTGDGESESHDMVCEQTHAEF